MSLLICHWLCFPFKKRFPELLLKVDVVLLYRDVRCFKKILISFIIIDVWITNHQTITVIVIDKLINGKMLKSPHFCRIVYKIPNRIEILRSLGNSAQIGNADCNIIFISRKNRVTPLVMDQIKNFSSL